MGKASPPPAPDYEAAARETAAGNLEAARYATQANRPDQITPYGSSTWEQAPATRTFNQQRYDEAVKAYNAQQAAASAGSSYGHGGTTGGEGGSIYAHSPLLQQMNGVTPGTAYRGSAPDRNADEFWDSTPSDKWTQRITLDPRAQQVLDKQMDMSNRYADLATMGLDKAWETLSDPYLDMSGIPERAINPGMTAQQAIMARLQPEFDRQEEALRTRLANQGVTMGSEAFSNDYRNFSQKRNDAELQAALLGINVDDANRKSAIAEQAYLQDRPLSLVNALRSGMQVQQPNFPGFAQQQTTSGPNLLGAADMQYSAGIDAANAENAGLGSIVGGLFSLGGSALFRGK